jgi:CubicO group peptidase (beta-lactamase class C family)
MASEETARIASAAKSLYACVLGVVIAEGKLASADERVFDTYPEFMDVPDGEGPKEGRYAFDKDRDITFRQLICNTSGYMKPGEEPGKVFHYQTYGMNILTHSLARLYGYYDLEDPEGSPGFKTLIEEKLAKPIGARLDYTLSNFDLHERARLPIFGYYCQVHTNPSDAARLGWLWCNNGRWKERQVVPASWMREIVDVAPDILANAPEKDWVYGHGFWTNTRGKLWPGLPTDGFSACGAGGHFISVFPSLELVVVQNPGYYEGPGSRANPALLELVLNSLD